jgi:hypothetical protein
LESLKTFQKIAANFYWPKMRSEIFEYVRACDLCQRAKPAQNIAVGLHSASPMTFPMERVFIDFMGPLTRSKRGNVAILAVLDGFSKFVTFYPTRRITSNEVCETGTPVLPGLRHTSFDCYRQRSGFPIQRFQGSVFSLGHNSHNVRALLPSRVSN